MPELTVNLHIHTPYSDGASLHAQIAQAALETGLDVVIITDHNILVRGIEGYYEENQDRVLLLVGEEIHDRTHADQKNHLLVLGAEKELIDKGDDPQGLVDAAARAGGLSFIAHPVEYAAPSVGQHDISWVDWSLHGFTGIEIWNGFSEFKSLLKSKLHALFYAYYPKRIAHSPFPETLERWDQLLSEGGRVVAIGGSDAHALPASMGPLRRTLFPYQYHFRAINTHLIVPEPLSGKLASDKKMVYEALREGHAFVGYDLPAPTRGFRFKAQGKEHAALMGDEIPAKNGVTLQITLPRRCECRLLKNGEEVKTWNNRVVCTHITTEPGVYRVEAYIHYKGKRRGWIFSNPIYVRG